MISALRANCGELNAQRVGQSVVLQGWVHGARDHGGVIFIDVRDRFGITQAVFNPADAPAAAEIAATLHSEDVIEVLGIVRRRPTGTDNPKLSTGEIELAPQSLRVLNRSLTPPFPVHGDDEAEEGLRMKYRYVDLRRPRLQRNLAVRHRAIKAVRDYLDALSFLEIETPVLIKQTPEGARDFIVPSRLHTGEFYALPQSPQLFKQLLMVAGFQRYFQIARCFRDEDSRADRQPEFTQIDLEMAFATQEDIMDVVEGALVHMFSQTLDVIIARPFRRLTHAEALASYGTDKPDLRFGLELTDVSAAFAKTEFKIFASALEAGQRIIGLVEQGGGSRSRRDFDGITAAALELGARGLAWVAVGADGVKTSLPKAALTTASMHELEQRAGLKTGDALFLVADEPQAALAIAGKLRLHLAQDKGWRDPKRFEFCWVVDFPLFERDTRTGTLGAAHHPFTAPAPGSETLAGDPLRLQAQHYDVVLNGSELGSGSIRVHDALLQRKIFALLGYAEGDVRDRFGFLLDALAYGAPPHGGMALGVDRIIALMVGADSIRDVIAFPKNQRFQDVMIGAPSPVPPEVLQEMRLRFDYSAGHAARG